MRTVDGQIGFETLGSRIRMMGEGLTILAQPLLVGFRVPILHMEHFVLSVWVAQGGHEVGGVFERLPVREQVLDQMVPRLCTNDRLKDLSNFFECGGGLGERVVDHGGQARRHASRALPSLVQIADVWIKYVKGSYKIKMTIIKRKLTMRGGPRSDLQLGASFEADFVIRFEKAPRCSRRLALATVVTPATEVTGEVPNDAVRAP